MLRVLADYHHYALALDDSALVTNRFDARSYFHLQFLLNQITHVLETSEEG
jgi:hypothetical protein